MKEVLHPHRRGGKGGKKEKARTNFGLIGRSECTF